MHVILIIVFAAIVALGFGFADDAAKEDVIINEVCTSNVTCLRDDNGDYPDWIEIYNPTGAAVDISGYTVSKGSRSKKEKFTVPEGILLDPGSFYVLDPGFTLSSDGCFINLLNAQQNQVDAVSTPGLKYDTSYARVTDGDKEWSIKVPTPGWENSDGKVLAATIEGNVMASAPSGFYDEEFELKLSSSNWGRSIYYTTDGSDPITDGILYDGSIRIYDRSRDANVYCMIPEVSLEYINGERSLPSFPVDKCTVIRAVAKDKLGRFTDVSTYTYFVGFNEKNAYDNMTVVSVNSDPDDLFSYEDGIMVLGRKYDEYAASGKPEGYDDDTANFMHRGRGSEISTRVLVFDEGHNRVLDSACSLRMKGLSSRGDAQKSFSVIFHEAIGGKYKEDFTVDGEDFRLHSFALDKCGQDDVLKMKDTIMEKCMESTGCATVRRVPCCVFLSGEYWGFYWLSERFDGSHFADRYGVDKNDIEEMDTYLYEPDSYAAWPEGSVDRDALIEYFAGNIIAAHEGDWPYMNFRIWRTVSDEGTGYGDGMYRPIIFDMNSTSMENPALNSFEYIAGQFAPFARMSEDDETFRLDLVDKIDEMSAASFSKERVKSLIDDIYGRIRMQMILDQMRYTDCGREESERSFDENTRALMDFFDARYGYLDEYKEEYLNGK